MLRTQRSSYISVTEVQQELEIDGCMAPTGICQALSRTTEVALPLSDKELGAKSPTHQVGNLCGFIEAA